MSELSREQIEELFERSKDDRAIIVGSEVRQLCAMALRVDGLEREVERLRKDPGETLSDHPGCVYCMEAGAPVKDGEVCPRCGDRLPTRRERELKRQLAEAEKDLDAAKARAEAAERKQITYAELAAGKCVIQKVIDTLGPQILCSSAEYRSLKAAAQNIAQKPKSTREVSQ